MACYLPRKAVEVSLRSPAGDNRDPSASGRALRPLSMQNTRLLIRTLGKVNIRLRGLRLGIEFTPQISPEKRDCVLLRQLPSGPVGRLAD